MCSRFEGTSRGMAVWLRSCSSSGRCRLVVWIHSAFIMGYLYNSKEALDCSLFYHAVTGCRTREILTGAKSADANGLYKDEICCIISYYNDNYCWEIGKLCTLKTIVCAPWSLVFVLCARECMVLTMKLVLIQFWDITVMVLCCSCYGNH